MANEIRIDGVVGTGEGEVSAAIVRAQLDLVDRTKPLTVRIHSEGGSVFEGFAIYDMLKAYEGPKKCVIESSAFSISSFIPMAFDEVEITPNGYMMIHNPYVETSGDDDELASQSELLRNLKSNMIAAYSARTGKSVDEVAAMLKKETYLSASQALAQGFVSRVTQTPVKGRVFAKLDKMPHGVVAALFDAGSGGEKSEPTKVKPMSESQPVAATLNEIEAAFPQAKAEFVIKCLKKSLPMASVAQAAVEEMMAENAAMAAKCQAMEEELAKYKGMSTEEQPASEMTVEVEEEEVMPSARRRGVAPVAIARKPAGVSAKDQWDAAINSELPKHKSKSLAVSAVNRKHPGLRAQMLSEVNQK